MWESLDLRWDRRAISCDANFTKIQVEDPTHASVFTVSDVSPCCIPVIVHPRNHGIDVHKELEKVTDLAVGSDFLVVQHHTRSIIHLPRRKVQQAANDIEIVVCVDGRHTNFVAADFL